jgi:NAD(P)-dependent dehydrogenase (short-subunit alcohol dehydrogenase family)
VIVNITSVSAAYASPERMEYCMSKAAQSMMSQAWAVRLAECGVNVFEIRPGIIETDMTSAVQEKYDDFIASGSLLQSRWGQPEDIGRAVAMLVRGDLPYGTGQVLTLDGGFSVKRL